ncbi:hypothetical protein [Eudoraea sp.]|uniref:hypothetical protein n=1 Tax=Eudoraea sp. TaxID=1979955 RepID=UPI003C77115E
MLITRAMLRSTPDNHREAIFASFKERRIQKMDAEANLIQFYKKQRTFVQKEWVVY